MYPAVFNPRLASSLSLSIFDTGWEAAAERILQIHFVDCAYAALVTPITGGFEVFTPLRFYIYAAHTYMPMHQDARTELGGTLETRSPRRPRHRLSPGALLRSLVLSSISALLL